MFCKFKSVVVFFKNLDLPADIKTLGVALSTVEKFNRTPQIRTKFEPGTIYLPLRADRGSNSSLAGLEVFALPGVTFGVSTCSAGVEPKDDTSSSFPLVMAVSFKIS